MIWFFARGSQSLRVETRYDNVTAEFLLVVPRQDGVGEIERFRDADAFRTRLEALQEQLQADHWTAVGQPVLLKDGWKLT
jgi:hypothetical protein